jgi:hypothetical protein
LLRNPIRGGQGQYWAVEPYDDDDDDDCCSHSHHTLFKEEAWRNYVIRKLTVF